MELGRHEHTWVLVRFLLHNLSVRHHKLYLVLAKKELSWFEVVRQTVLAGAGAE